MRRTFQFAFVPHVAFVLPIEANPRPHFQPLISHGASCGRSWAPAPQTERTAPARTATLLRPPADRTQRLTTHATATTSSGAARLAVCRAAPWGREEGGADRAPSLARRASPRWHMCTTVYSTSRHSSKNGSTRRLMLRRRGLVNREGTLGNHTVNSSVFEGSRTPENGFPNALRGAGGRARCSQQRGALLKTLPGAEKDLLRSIS